MSWKNEIRKESGVYNDAGEELTRESMIKGLLHQYVVNKEMVLGILLNGDWDGLKNWDMAKLTETYKQNMKDFAHGKDEPVSRPNKWRTGGEIQ